MLSLAKGVALWLSKRQVGYAVIRIGTDFRLQLVRALENVRWRYFVDMQPGVLANSLSYEAETASNVYFHVARMAAGGVYLAVNLGLATLVSWQISIVVLIAGCLNLILFSSLLKLAHEAGSKQNIVLEKVTGYLVDFLNGFKPLKSMGREEMFTEVISHEVYELNLAKQKEVLAKETMAAFQEPFAVIMIVTGVALAYTFSSASGSVLMVILFLFYRMMSYIAQLQQSLQSIYRCRGVYHSLQSKITNIENQARITQGVKPKFASIIRFEGVGYAYYDGKMVLSNVNLDIRSGSFTALVGATGSGKTTLIDMLCGLLTPTQGAILLDGEDLASIDQRAWRKQIGYVPQELFLFNDTVRMNVALGEELADEDIWHALDLAVAGDFVRLLPDGLDSPLGEQGRSLSGGQRQRIMIARALARKPVLLILDEATTGLDEVTEKKILDSLVTLKGEMTVIAISHQLALRKAADQVFLIENGLLQRELLRISQ